MVKTYGATGGIKDSMPADQDLLFGRIAVELGFCSAKAVEGCIKKQAASDRPMSLGHHLVQEGHLTEEQHSKVLEQQRRNLARKDPVTRVSKGEVLFGRLVVREGFATQEQVNAALREQGQSGDRRSLGEVLMARGVLNAAEVDWILKQQSKWIMRCPKCANAFTVHSSSRNPQKASCPRCAVPLEAVEEASASSAGGIETSIMRSPPPKPPPGASGQCKICRNTVVSMPSSDGRVECLRCRVRFVP
jgi:ribosomal protein S27E